MVDDSIARGLEAWRQHDWTNAYEALRPLVDRDGATPEALEALAESAWWCARVDQTILARERAFGIYSAEGRKVDAARVATLLAENHAHRLQTSMARGWLRRAVGLLEGQSTTRELGHLKRLEAVFAAGSEGGLEKALSLAAEVEHIGREMEDRDLEMLGIHDRGHFLVSRGDVDEGMVLMEDSMISAVAGELSPQITGRIYCNMIETCAQMADYERAGEWSDRAMLWCETQGGTGGYPGICRVRRSEMMRLRGAWDAAEQEATRAADELGDFGPYMAAAFSEIGMIRLNLGDLSGAEEAFRQAHALGANPMPGLALLKLAKGDAAAAMEMIESAIDGTEEMLARAKLLPGAIEIALAAESPEIAGARSAELEKIASRYDSDLLETYAMQSRGRIAAFATRYGEAVVLLRGAVDRLVAAGLPYEAAKARCDLGVALMATGSPELGNLEIEAARLEFVRLGATADVDRLAAMAAPRTEVAEAVSALMFTDIVDSTSLVGVIGDSAWMDLISWHNRTLRNLFEHNGGREVDHTGDGFFASFESAQDAARCAIEIQQSLRRHRNEAGFSPRVRIGIHIGTVLESKGTLVGRDIHVAARVGSAADGDEILVSSDVAAALDEGFAIAREREIDAKGIDEPVVVSSLVWEP